MRVLNLEFGMIVELMTYMGLSAGTAKAHDKSNKILVTFTLLHATGDSDIVGGNLQQQCALLFSVVTQVM